MTERCVNLSTEGLGVEEFITNDTNKKVWVIHIPKHRPKLPVYAHNKAWQRIEDSLVELTQERLNAILEGNGPVFDWSAEIVENAILDDLDGKALAKARDEYKAVHPRLADEVDEWDYMELLNRAGVAIESKLTRAAILLLGKETAVHLISPAVATITWVLTDNHDEKIDYEHFHTPFILTVNEALSKIRNLNQRILPDGGLGNLVALPLQGQARRNGNSVFVDDNFQPYSDQWSFLLSIQKLSESTIDDILQKHASTLGELTKNSEGKPWETPKPKTIDQSDFTSSITLTRANMLYIPLSCMSAKVVNYFKRTAAFHNQESYDKQGMRLSTYDVPRIISCSELIDDYLAQLRGREEKVIDFLEANGVAYVIDDKTCHGLTIEVSFKGELCEEQQQAMSCMLPHPIGTLSATTAFGKTVFAIAMIAQRKVNTLILVHRKSLTLP